MSDTAKQSGQIPASDTVSAQAPSAENWESLEEPIAWSPSEEYIRHSRLQRFLDRHGLADVAALNARANADPAWFWGAIDKDLELVWQKPYTQVMDTSRGIPWTKWWIDGDFNYVQNALDKHAEGSNAGKTALIWEGEDGAVRRFSYAELLALT